MWTAGMALSEELNLCDSKQTKIHSRFFGDEVRLDFKNRMFDRIIKFTNAGEAPAEYLSNLSHRHVCT